MVAVFTVYILTFLIPVNGLIFLGMRRERMRMRSLAEAMARIRRIR